MDLIKNIFAKGILLYTSILFLGCSSTISLNRSPSDLVLLTLKPNNTHGVIYSVDSRVADPFVYKNNAGYSFNFQINQAFKNNIDAYMQTKFSKIYDFETKNDSTLTIKYDLKNIELFYELEQNTGEVLSTLFGSGGAQGNAIVEVKITVLIEVTKNGVVESERNILSTSKYNEYLQYGVKVESIYQKAVNDGISKCIIMIDKHLSSINL